MPNMIPNKQEYNSPNLNLTSMILILWIRTSAAVAVANRRSSTEEEIMKD